jgi:hypothetical protein
MNQLDLSFCTKLVSRYFIMIYFVFMLDMSK